MKRVIVLYGRGMSGKTPTLNLLIDLLYVATTNNPMPEPQERWHDRRNFFHYKGKIIGIATQGDYGVDIEENGKFFIENSCDTMFMPTRTWGQTCIALGAFSERNHIQATWVKKKYSESANEEFKINLQQAKDLFALI